MQRKKIHSFAVVMVLCCYFIALTPFHAMYHFAESLIIHDSELACDDIQEHSSTENTPLTCGYCQFISFEGTNSFLLPSQPNLFLVVQFKVQQLIHYQAPLFISFSGALSTLRAPPVL